MRRVLWPLLSLLMTPLPLPLPQPSVGVEAAAEDAAASGGREGMTLTMADGRRIFFARGNKNIRCCLSISRVAFKLDIATPKVVVVTLAEPSCGRAVRR